MANLEPQQFYNSIEKAVESGRFAPVYFFHGEEPYLLQQATQYLKVCALYGGATDQNDNGAADFNFNSYYAADVDVSQVRDEVETLPMMADRRVVIVKEAQDLTDVEWETLDPLLKTPVDSTVLILVAGKMDKRRKCFKLLTDHAVTVEFKKPYENQIPGWIRHIAKAHKLSISDEAALLFHRLVGNQLLEIEAEIKKLVDFLDSRTHVELEDVAQVVSQKKEENVFDLTEAIGSGDRVLALTQLVRLLDQGQNEIGIVALVARHVRILLLLRQGMEQGFAGQKLAQYAQVPNYFLQDYLKQAQGWTNKKLEQVVLILTETDRALKSSPVSSHIWLENMTIKACGLFQSGLHSRSTNI
jgi:DNA polymerase-3 subunit delta